MPYIDIKYYIDTYKGVEVDSSTFLRLEARASETIDAITKYRVATSPNKLGDYHPFIRDQFKKAVAAQVEHLVNKEQGASASVTIGKFKYSAPSGTSTLIAESVYSHLAPTGLLYAGVDG